MNKLHELSQVVNEAPFEGLMRANLEAGDLLASRVVTPAHIVRMLHGEYSTGDILVDAACVANIMAYGIAVDVDGSDFQVSFWVPYGDPEQEKEITQAFLNLSRHQFRVPVWFRNEKPEHQFAPVSDIVALEGEDVAAGRFPCAPKWAIGQMSPEEVFEKTFSESSMQQRAGCRRHPASR